MSYVCCLYGGISPVYLGCLQFPPRNISIKVRVIVRMNMRM